MACPSGKRDDVSEQTVIPAGHWGIVATVEKIKIDEWATLKIGLLASGIWPSWFDSSSIRIFVY